MANEKPCELRKLGDRLTSDVIVRLRTRDGRDDWFYCHSDILIKQSKFFADRLSDDWPVCQFLDSRNCIEVYCHESEYDHHVNLLRLFYPGTSLVRDLWKNVKSALDVLKVATNLGCDQIISKCVQYLEAVPWEEQEEEEIIETLPMLGSEAIPILARIQPVDPNAVKNVFLSAMHVAVSTNSSILNMPACLNDLKTSAQEQVEYMLVEDEDAPLLAVDDEVKCESRKHVLLLFETFEKELASLPYAESHAASQEDKILKILADFLWLCHILPKMDLLGDFVNKWAECSDCILRRLNDPKFTTSAWEIKLKIIEITGKVLEAVGYGNVILSAPKRTDLVKVWLPFIRETKQSLDRQDSPKRVSYQIDGHPCQDIDLALTKENLNSQTFPEKVHGQMDCDLCQSIESAFISLVLALPSSDQAEILAEWLKAEQAKFPDLSEAFEVWCYRSKAAKRRLSLGLNGKSSTSSVSNVGST
eukprot:TRINITY_DN2364_c0_g2_i2.p1 TRINITY_DN2364_c0_g2~~TRINITY_DN2364_c0_g2_i2.p1  ORF type:complete len:475 (+),score=91.48 TRINITY_DN2364_c0_g2_i2:398-1822(+)